jgi:hypothetical protein
MKLVARFLSLTLLAGAALFYASCDGGDGDTKSDEEIQLEALSKTWTLTDAELDNAPRFADFTGMKLTLSGAFTAGGTYNYSITGTTPTPSPWPRSGTWKFGADVKIHMIRNPGTGASAENLEMNYSLSNGILTISFTCTDCNYDGGGRVSSVDGPWVFTFN